MQSKPSSPTDLLADYERTISPLFKEVSLVVEIPLAPCEIDQIEAALKQLLARSNPASVTRWLRDRASCTLACYLVWKGISGYQHGDYWSAICSSVGLPKPNWSSRWGRLFEEVLERYRLPTFPHSKAHRFVAPILLHGGIPLSCLDDFFQRLVWPTAMGKLYYDNAIGDLLAQWDSCSLHYNVDKPVIRFLREGGTFASNLLERCLELAFAAAETDALPDNDFVLPKHVYEGFREWFGKRRDSADTTKGQEIQHFRRPQIVFNPSAQTLVLIFPQQRLSGAKIGQSRLFLDVLTRDHKTATELLKAYKSRRSVQTEVCYVALGRPASDWKIQLRADQEKLRTWHFEGLTDDHPWLAFNGRAAVLTNGNVDSDFWLIHPSDLKLASPVKPVEVAPAGQLVEAAHFSFEGFSGAVVELESDKKAIRIKPAGEGPPFLSSEKSRLNELFSGDFEYFQEDPPNLVIPTPANGRPREFADRLLLSIKSEGSTHPNVSIRQRVGEIIGGRHLDSSLAAIEIPLGDNTLLGSDARGHFRVSLRGKLGHDRVFKICVLPRIGVDIDGAVQCGDQMARWQFVAVSVPPEWEVRTDKPVLIPEDSGRHTFRLGISTADDMLSFNIVRDEKPSVEIPLEFQLPRLRWATGSSEPQSIQWHEEAVSLTMEDLEQSDLRLLINTGVPDDAICVARLAEINQAEPFSLRNGLGGLPLRVFLDSLRSYPGPRCEVIVDLKAPGITISRTALSIETSWIVSRFQVLAEHHQDGRKFSCLFAWRESGVRGSRILRLWPIDCGASNPISFPIPDGQDSLLVEINDADIPAGRYRAQFLIDDPWTSGLSTPPDAYDDNAFEIKRKGSSLTLGERTGEESRSLAERIASGASTGQIQISSDIADNLRHNRRFRKQLLESLAERHRQRGDLSLALGNICGAEHGQPDIAAVLASTLLKSGLALYPEFIHSFCDSLAEIGYLAKPWPPDLKTLFVKSFREKQESSIGKEKENKLSEQLMTVYRATRWRSTEIAVELLLHLLAHTSALKYGVTPVHGVEGIQQLHEQDFIRVWCGWVKKKRSSTPTYVYISLSQFPTVIPSEPDFRLILILLATLDRGSAHQILSVDEDYSPELVSISRTALKFAGRTLADELEWAEKTMSRRSLSHSSAKK